MSKVYLILHGRGGNAPDHWQNHLARGLRDAGGDVRYPRFSTPNDPRVDTWVPELRAALDGIPMSAGLTVFAHSLGSILWMRYAASGVVNGPRAERVLLVAPPYIVREIPLAGQPPGNAAFYPPPMSPKGIASAGRETAIVASDTDDFATFAQSEAYASALGVPIYKLAGAGHISPFYGYGEWQWVLEWALRRRAPPPSPNDGSA